MDSVIGRRINPPNPCPRDLATNHKAIDTRSSQILHAVGFVGNPKPTAPGRVNYALASPVLHNSLLYLFSFRLGEVRLLLAQTSSMLCETMGA